MLSNYDADAIADVLGLTFARNDEILDPKGSSANGAPMPRRIVVRSAEDGVVMDDVGERRIAPSHLVIEEAIEIGLPRQALRHLAERIVGSDSAMASTLEWKIVPKSTLDRRTTGLSSHESERTERLARLFVNARRALGTEAEARDFMTTPHPELDGRSPLAAAMTDIGTRRAEHILNALEYGLAL